MDKELNLHDEELIDLGAVTDETYGAIEGFDSDGLQKRLVIGFLVD